MSNYHGLGGFGQIADRVYSGCYPPITREKARRLAAELILEGYRDLDDAREDLVILRKVDGIRFTAYGEPVTPRTLETAIRTGGNHALRQMSYLRN